MWVQSLGQENLLEEAMATHSSIPAWKIPWTEKPGGLQSTRLQRVGHYRATEQHVVKRFWNMFRGGGGKVHVLPLEERGLLGYHYYWLCPWAEPQVSLPSWPHLGACCPVHCFVRCSEEFPIPLSLEKTCPLSVSIGVDPLVYRLLLTGHCDYANVWKSGYGAVCKFTQEANILPFPWRETESFFFFWGYYFTIYLFGHATWGILVHWPGIKPTPPAGAAWSFNHWTIREVSPRQKALMLFHEALREAAASSLGLPGALLQESISH